MCMRERVPKHYLILGGEKWVQEQRTSAKKEECDRPQEGVNSLDRY